MPLQVLENDNEGDLRVIEQDKSKVHSNYLREFNNQGQSIYGGQPANKT